MAEAGSEASNRSLIARSSEYFKGCADELKKVSHPTRQEAVQLTLVTLFIIGFIALCLMLLDLVFDQLMRALLS